MRKPLAVFALLGFVISLTVHISTFLNYSFSSEIPAIWLLHIGLFVAFGPFVYYSNKDGNKGLEFLDGKWWIKALSGFFFYYAIVNFAIFIFLMREGGPSNKDGIYTLSNHGRFVRTLTIDEYHKFRSYEIRGFSGHWMIFYLIPGLYFSRKKKNLV